MPDQPSPPAVFPQAAPEGDPAAGVDICASADLAERGRGALFDVVWRQEATRAFVLRHEGKVVAYLNRCAHVPAELDWNPGDFLDDEGAFIVCSIHGAAYHPGTGRCAGGPCGRSGLVPVPVGESGGRVYWYPCADLKPAPRHEP